MGALKRNLTIGLAAAAALAMPAAAAAQTAPAAYQADIAHSGAAAGTTFNAPLGKRWVRRDLGERPTYPVMAEGRVYLTAGTSVYALSRATGATIWSRSVRNPEGVAYDDGKVFVVGDGVIQALQAGSGRVIWTTNLSESTSFSPPVAYDGFVHTSSRDTLYGINQDTGLVLWSRGAATTDAAVPALDANRAFTSEGSDAAAIERRTGARVWERDTSSGGFGGYSPVLNGDRLFAGGTVFDALTGLTRDTYAATRPPAFAGSVGYFVNGPELSARDSGGIVRWRYRHSDNSYESNLRVAPLVAGNHVYTVTEGGTLIAVNRVSGAKVWQSDLRSESSQYETDFSGLGAAGNTLVVSYGGRVVGYSPGPDAPGVDDPDKPELGDDTLSMSASNRRIAFGRLVTLTGQLNAPYSESRQVQIQHDPWPYGQWQGLRVITPDSSSFTIRVKPQRNTRYRAVYTGTNPIATTKQLTVLTDIRSSFRVFARSRRRVQVRITLAGPPSAKLRGARVHVYHFRARSRTARRIGTIKVRGKGRRVRGRKTLRTPTLRRTDLFFVCRREKRDDGFGQPDKRLRLCGRKRLR